MHGKATHQDGEQQTYSDGHPLDEVHYLECKIILKPDRFTSAGSFHEFGKLVRHAAAELEIAYSTDLVAGQKPRIREVLFFDTPDFRLYNNAFILRRRIPYVDGFPADPAEVVMKFRHPDRDAAAKVDVRPAIPGAFRIKFKEELLPPHDTIGGMRSLYSHNCVFNLSREHDERRLQMTTVVNALPALASLMKSTTEKIELVNHTAVEEVLLDLGEVHFGHGVSALANVALWRARADHSPLVGEFSYQCKFEQRNELHSKSRKQCEKFFLKLQQVAGEWLSLGSTKTGIVYRLNGNPPQGHE